MKCSNCRFDNPEGSKFCNECGQKLVSAAKPVSQPPSFDDKLSRIQRHLPQSLTEKTITQRDRIEGERKHVTVMFCDMEGFTPLVERLGPEASYEIMDQIYEILIREVNDFEGTVNEMTGDGIMALFGAPIALEEAPQRALWSALSIHRELAKFNSQKQGIGTIRMRIGVHSGPVVVGTLGNDLRVEFKAVGDTVNLASRMEGMAEPGSTYVTGAIHMLTRGLFRFKAIGKKTVKGKSEPITVYKLLSAREDIYRHRLGAERMIYSEMVGRSRELDQLVHQLEKVIKGEGSIVNIVGEAGAGKSRLLTEWKKHDLVKNVTLIEGRAISMGRNLSFHPIIGLLKQWMRIRSSDKDAVAEKKLETAVRSLYPDRFGEVIPFIATLMGLKLSDKYQKKIQGIEGEALENLILKSARELLTKACELTRLVIVIDDLHWADTSSIELLISLLRLTETQSILWINLFRPGYEETGQRLIAAIKEKFSDYYVELALDPLDEDLSEKLIGNMVNVGGLHHPVIGQIVQRAGGNPFFIEEVVRSFIDEGAVVLKNGKFEVTEKIEAMSIPRTINDVLMARIDRLEEKTRYLLKVASVIGRHFFHRIISDVVQGIQDLDAKLNYLKDIQLIREHQRMQELEYLFKHALAQEAAYDSILPQRRKSLHLQVARTIEKVFGDKLHEFYGMLAYHYSRADNLDKAEEALVKAGEEALKSSASSEALHYYQEALDIYLRKYGETADPEIVAELEKNIAVALYNRGLYEEAVVYFDKALNYYWGKKPKSPFIAGCRFMSEFSHLLISLYLPALKFKKTPTDRDLDALDLFLKKLKALSVINAKVYFVDSFQFYKRLAKFDLTQFEGGIGFFEGASTLFSFTGISFRLSRKILDYASARVYEDKEKMFIVHDLCETIHDYMQGNWKSIRDPDDELVNKNLSIGEVYWTSQHYHWHGLPQLYQGNLDVAEGLVQKLADIHDLFENDLCIMLKFLLSSGLLMERRKFDEALQEIEAGIVFGQKNNLGTTLIHMFSCRARIEILKENLAEAKRALDQAEKIKNEVETVPWMLSNYCCGRVEYDLYWLNESIKSGAKRQVNGYGQKAHESAEALLKQSQKVAQHRTEAHRLMGVYCWLMKKQKKALRCWDRSIKEGERLGARLELARTYFEVGKRLLEARSKSGTLNGIKAEAYLEKAGVLFKEMDLPWDLAELERVVGMTNVE
ncbi:Adenylate cyclase (EC / Guanylate cyclase (EC [Olavius algarvensis Delta 1 endosymbiont]|nr:Adenylate cyclase (EC / Guanylate cyclase (EC [Olavius algarvensis Delta 1 endosymbiont]